MVSSDSIENVKLQGQSGIYISFSFILCFSFFFDQCVRLKIQDNFCQGLYAFWQTASDLGRKKPVRETLCDLKLFKTDAEFKKH